MADIEKQLVESLASESINLTSSFGELALDSILDDGVFKDIPFISTLVSFYKANKSFKHRRYIRNMLTFLNEFNKIDMNKRKLFIYKNLKHEKDREKFGETIFFLVEKADDQKKPELYARIFELHINGECSYDNAIRICRIIDRSFCEDLVYLLTFDNTVENALVNDELYKNGLLSFGRIEPKDKKGITIISPDDPLPYVVNIYGKLVKRILLNK